MTEFRRTLRELLEAAIADMERVSQERHQLDDREEVLIGDDSEPKSTGPGGEEGRPPRPPSEES